MEFTKKNIKLICEDNMVVMAKYPDKYFDISVLDPPYGLKCFDGGLKSGTRFKKFEGRDDVFNKVVENDYIKEVFRISKRVIIQGANNFDLPTTEYFIVWNKKQTVDNFASAELAFCYGIKNPAKIFDYGIHKHNARAIKIHPTQKPVILYDFCFDYAKAQKDWKVFDANFGSASSAISAYYLDFAEYVGVDIDKSCFNDAVNRIKTETLQQRLFQLYITEIAYQNI